MHFQLFKEEQKVKIHLKNQKQQSSFSTGIQTMPYQYLPMALILVFMSWLSTKIVLAQKTVAECGPSLLPLAPCGPFVQGVAASPDQQCCDGLAQLYRQRPICLCLLLNDTSLGSSFPINRTLALQLPILCSLRIDPSACEGISLPSLAPPARVTFGAKPNASVAASPIVTVAPRPSFMGFGFQHSAEVRLKADQGQLLMLLMAIGFCLQNMMNYSSSII